MPFRNQLKGRFQIKNHDSIQKRASTEKSEDPRSDFYRAILDSDGSFEKYYLAVGELVVQPGTTSYKVNADMEVKYALKRGWIANSQEGITEGSFNSFLSDIDLEIVATEGEVRLVSHLRRERNRGLVEAKKIEVLKKTGSLKCEVCGFDFSIVYGGFGKGFCEVHHIKPLSTLKDATTTKLNDLAILCSNCHRIIHRSDPMLSISELTEIVEDSH